MKRVTVLLLAAAIWLTAGDLYYYNNGRQVTLQPVEGGVTPRNMNEKVKLFRRADGETVMVANRLILRLSDPSRLEEYTRKYGLRLIKGYTTPGLYLMETSDVDGAIAVANALREEPDVLFAQPDVGRKRRLR